MRPFWSSVYCWKVELWTLAFSTFKIFDMHQNLFKQREKKKKIENA